MKIRSKFFVLPICLVLSVSLLLTGCGKEAPTKDPSALLQQAVYNLFGVSSLRYKVDLTADTKDTKTSKEASIDLSLNGAVSSKDAAKAGSELSAVIKFEDKSSGEYRFDVSVKSLKDSLYFKLLSLPKIPGFPADGLSSLVGTWWQVDMKQLQNFQVSTTGIDNFGTSYDKLNELDKKKRDLVLSSKFFKDMEFDGEEDLNGVKTYKYDFAIDVDGFVKYLKDLAVLKGQKADSVPDTLKQSLTEANLSGSLWIDSVNTVLVKAELEADSASSATVRIENAKVAFSVSDLNQPFSIETPSDYKVFDLGAFFGAFLGASGGTMPALTPTTPGPSVSIPTVPTVPTAPVVVPAK